MLIGEQQHCTDNFTLFTAPMNTVSITLT